MALLVPCFQLAKVAGFCFIEPGPSSLLGIFCSFHETNDRYEGVSGVWLLHMTTSCIPYLKLKNGESFEPIVC